MTIASHPEVIRLLEVYLNYAKINPMAAVAIAMCSHPNQAATDFAGETQMEPHLQESLERLLGKVKDSIDVWALPKTDESLDRSHVVFDVAAGPLNHDFLIWLVDAEMTRRRHGAPAPLKVAFWLGKDAEERLGYDNRRQWLEMVFRPLLRMIGAVEGDNIHGWSKRVYVPRDIVKGCNDGEMVPLLRSGLPPRSPGAVTITLRESWYWPHRNSNKEAWLRFAEYLRSAGENVVIVRDTEKAFDNFADFATDPEASLYTAKRMALYESAKCNIFTASGPVGLALFSKRPWLQFVKLEDDDSPYKPNTKAFWQDANGIVAGGQYPWSTPDQRIVWAADTFDNILEAWKTLNIEGALSYGT